MGFFDFFKTSPKSGPTPTEVRSVPCENCGEPAPFLGNVDFNKSCMEWSGFILPRSGQMVDYYLCDACGFCFAPEFRHWTLADFAEKIYNNEYIQVDPDYTFVRPNGNAMELHNSYAASKDQIRHLDYGGGSGLLSNTLRDMGWNSMSYDPMVDVDTDVTQLGRYNLVTAFEVFEHVPDINALADRLALLCDDEGMIVFSTACSDGYVKRGGDLAWGYVSPRNGHISLFSNQSLKHMFSKRGMSLHSISRYVHVAYRRMPAWSRFNSAS